MITIEQIKAKQKAPSGAYLGNIILSNGQFKIVIVTIIDEENGIIQLKTNGKVMVNEPGWKFDGRFYIKEVFSDELNNVFHYNYSIPN